MYKETRKTTKCIDFKTQKYGLSRGGARGVPGGELSPQNFAWPPKCPPKIRSLSESPTQTIDSSPCCKTGPSSGPPK